uniref:Nuclear receptor domain-containing protein n=1 Tax=Meloidogyne hapla TaxID=6305 RepID=A0A1I8BL40_MELHA
MSTKNNQNIQEIINYCKNAVKSIKIKKHSSLKCSICDRQIECMKSRIKCCHACRMFFRRTVTGLRAYKCKHDGNCEITK